MSRYNIRIKTAQTDFIPVEQFTNYYPGSNVKRDLIKRYLVSIANVASPEQMKKFCDDFGISRDNYAQVVTLSHDTEFSDILTLNFLSIFLIISLIVINLLLVISLIT
jgi:hypothetical protein